MMTILRRERECERDDVHVFSAYHRLKTMVGTICDCSLNARIKCPLFFLLITARGKTRITKSRRYYCWHRPGVFSVISFPRHVLLYNERVSRPDDTEQIRTHCSTGLRSGVDPRNNGKTVTIPQPNPNPFNNNISHGFISLSWIYNPLVSLLRTFTVLRLKNNTFFIVFSLGYCVRCKKYEFKVVCAVWV